MKRILAFVLVALTASIVYGQTKTKAMPFDDGSRVAQLDEQFAGTITADKSNCDKMATDIKAFYAKNGAELNRLRQQGQKRTKEQQAEFQKKYGARIQAATQKLNVGISGCINNPKVKDALKEMK